MEDTFLYQQIAEHIRNDILTGRYKPDDRLPSVRQLCKDWQCTPGTIQRAYNELAHEGLLVSRAGRGTQVAGSVPLGKSLAQKTLRLVNLVHRSETFLLEELTGGYSLDEIQRSMDLAMDRWRTSNQVHATASEDTIHFVGSHDMAMNELAHIFFGRLVPDVSLELTYNGSLGGLIALAEGKADLAGCHLWDMQTDTYNLPFVQRLLPGKNVTIVTLAHRRQGLIVAPGNPHHIQKLADLFAPENRFVNRQSGSGTRVWLDAMFSRLGLDPKRIIGYDDERSTHSEVARAVAEGAATVGLGLENASRAYGLDFVYLNRERYDLVMRSETLNRIGMQKLIAWLASAEGKLFISSLDGYENQDTGKIQMPVPSI